jgi:NDP-sugar pyrophosphorylase family protein
MKAMGILNVHELFDLEDFEHKGLFDGVQFAWEVLPKIGEYLKSVLKKGNCANIYEGTILKYVDRIYIEDGVIIEPGAFIEGPCWIGKGSEIRHGAYIRGNVIIGNKCVIGHTTEVKNSVFLNGAKASHFAYVGDSILGNDVNLGAGTKLANLRFDRKEIIVKEGGEIHKTGIKKFGAILADGAQTGCNSVTNPGTVFLKGAVCRPCENVSGVRK